MSWTAFTALVRAISAVLSGQARAHHEFCRPIVIGSFLP